MKIVVALLALCAAGALAAEVDVQTYRVELAGESQRVDVYRPVGESAAGVAIVAHGFTRTRARHRDLGHALAAAGIVAVVPDLPNVVNLWGNGDAIARFEQLMLPDQIAECCWSTIQVNVEQFDQPAIHIDIGSI